jgi:hypothetical protein
VLTAGAVCTSLLVVRPSIVGLHVRSVQRNVGALVTVTAASLTPFRITVAVPAHHQVLLSDVKLWGWKCKYVRECV